MEKAELGSGTAAASGWGVQERSGSSFMDSLSSNVRAILRMKDKFGALLGL